MSKKTNNQITEVVNETTTNAKSLRELMTEYPNASLRKLAIACEISYGWVLKKSKEPVAGEPYDPESINYEAVETIFTKRGIKLEELDWESLNEATVRRGSTLIKDMSMFEVGQKVYLREDNTTPFEICYKTDTHIVIMKEGCTEPRSWSHGTFLMKGPVFTPRTITENSEEEEA